MRLTVVESLWYSAVNKGMPRRTRNRVLAIAATLALACAALPGQALATPPEAVAAPTPAAPPAPPAPAAPLAPATPPAQSPAVSVAAPDLIRLKNGGMLRGIIAESGGSFVTIVLVTGETRKIPAADVTYAGPAAAAPASAPVTPSDAASATDPGTRPISDVHVPEARVSFVAVPTGSSLSRRSSATSLARQASKATGYDEVCTAPCVASLPAGTHTFAVARPHGEPIEAKPVTLPTGSSTLTANYVDKSGNRIAFALLGAGAMVGGLVLELSALPNSGEPNSSIHSGPLFAGLALQAGGLVLILCSRSVKDRFELSVAPGAGAVLPALAPAANASMRTESRFLDQSSGSTANARNGAAGLHLNVRF